MLAALSTSLSSLILAPAAHTIPPIALAGRWDPAQARMSATEYDPLSDKRRWWRDLRAEMKEMEERMSECLDDEECALQVADELEDEFAQELLLRARERREEIDDIKSFISRLQDQRRAAVAMLWDDRTTERLLTNYN